MTNDTTKKENSNQFFYMFPKVLFQSPYNSLSLDAKMLYVMLLDRCRLSEKTGRRDKNGRTYVYYTVKEIASKLSCSQAHAVKLLAELDTISGAGLIERKRQGQGKPCMIYVNMLKCEEAAPDFASDGNGQNDFEEPDIFLPVSDIKDEEFSFDELNEDEFLNSMEEDSKPEEFASQDINDVASINNYKNNNYINNNESIISDHIISDDEMNEMIEKNNFTKEIVRANIDYEVAVDNFGESWTNAIVELITDVVCSKQKTIRINKQDYPQKIVAERFLELGYIHIENVYLTMRTVTSAPVNIRAYMITALYRSYETAEYWITSKAQSDLARERRQI